MRAVEPIYFARLLQAARIKPRLARELRFGASVAKIPSDLWSEMELVSISDRSGNEGILLIDVGQSLFVVPYSLSGPLTNPQTGRSKPVICDFCTTWQSGGNASSITFNSLITSNNVTFLCCADLKCSLHIRGKTSEALKSRSQLHEDLTPAQRVDRFEQKLLKLTSTLDAKPVSGR